VILCASPSGTIQVHEGHIEQNREWWVETIVVENTGVDDANSAAGVSDLHHPILSAFLIELAPGGSALPHRAPASGYVPVHVLLGSVTASSREPAEALVVLITEDVR
jgi:hypothetical protein